MVTMTSRLTRRRKAGVRGGESCARPKNNVVVGSEECVHLARL